MRSAPDTTPTCAPHSFGASGIALDSGGVLAIGIGASPLSAHITHPLRAAWAKSRLISQVRTELLSLYPALSLHDVQSCPRYKSQMSMTADAGRRAVAPARGVDPVFIAL